MGCTPISVSLEVNPSKLRKIIFDLDKICNDNNTVEWKLHFDLQERDTPNEDFLLWSLDVDINKETSLAEATAQPASMKISEARLISPDTAKATLDGTATQDEAKQTALWMWSPAGIQHHLLLTSRSYASRLCGLLQLWPLHVSPLRYRRNV
jgi:hypothetical protein